MYAPLLRQQQELVDALSVPTQRILAEFKAVYDVKNIVKPSSDWLAASQSLAAADSLTHSISTNAAEYFQRQSALLDAAQFTSQWSALRHLLEPFDTRLRVAGTPESRRAIVVEALETVFQDQTGLNPHPDTPAKVVANWFALIILVWQLILAVQASRRITAIEGDVLSLQDAKQQDAETIGALFSIIRQLQEKAAEQDQHFLRLRVTRRSPLRATPSGSAQRIATLSTGTTLKFINEFERWKYVEVLDKHGSPTGTIGWIRPRNVEMWRK